MNRPDYVLEIMPDSRMDLAVTEFILHGHRQLQDAGLYPFPNMPNLWSQAIVARSVVGEIIGVLTFNDGGADHDAWVNFSMVLPEYRKQGIHKNMLGRLQDLAVANGWAGIGGGAHPDNTEMLAVAAATGRHQYAILYRWDNPQRVRHGEKS